MGFNLQMRGRSGATRPGRSGPLRPRGWKHLTGAAALSLCLAMPAAAQSLEDQVVSQLSEQGFGQVEMNRTLLGRLRFVAQSDRYRRELVIHPSTGAVLFDRVTGLDGDDEPIVRLDGEEEFEEELEEDFDEDEDDEDEEEDEDDDEDDDDGDDGDED